MKSTSSSKKYQEIQPWKALAGLMFGINKLMPWHLWTCVLQVLLSERPTSTWQAQHLEPRAAPLTSCPLVTVTLYHTAMCRAPGLPNRRPSLPLLMSLPGPALPCLLTSSPCSPLSWTSSLLCPRPSDTVGSWWWEVGADWG